MQLMTCELPLFLDDRAGGKRSNMGVKLLDILQIGGLYCKAGTFAEETPPLP